MRIPDLNTCFSKNNTIAVRGISALGVLLFHIIISFHISPVFNFPGGMFVAVFLIVSGYGINESYKANELKGYWIKRMNKVIIPSVLFICGYNLLYNGNVSNMIAELLDIEPTFWFVFHIIKCYLAYWVAMRFFSGNRSVLFMVICAVACLFYNVSGVHLESEQSFSFLTGVLVSRYKDRVFKIPPKRLASIVCCCFCVGAVFYVVKLLPAVHALKGTVPFNLFLMPFRLTWGVVCLYIFTWIGVGECVFLQKIGKYSLDIYIAHIPYIGMICSSKSLLAFLWLSIISFLPLLLYHFIVDYLSGKSKKKC